MSRRSLRDKFFAEHPRCCFCGGEQEAVQEDHVPSRATFLGRAWPEGHVFPACERCNKDTSMEEAVVAMLASLNPISSAEETADHVVRLGRGLKRNHPAALEELSLTTEERTRFAVSAGMRPEDVKALKVSGPHVQRAILRFGRKLALALYYKHIGKILPKDGGVLVRRYTNLEACSRGIPANLRRLATRTVELRRSGKSLEDQFAYRWGRSESGDSAVFFCKFARSFFLVLLVHQQAGVLQSARREPVLRPG